jgi:polyamine oxidase
MKWSPPNWVVTSTWLSNPNFGGAYSSLKPGGTPEHRDRIAARIYAGLRFAGEHTSSAYPGTMHGAWFSGEAAAQALIHEGNCSNVVVVGGGFAGIAAAKRLQTHGSNVIVLEAEPLPGGRAATSFELPGGPVHLGGAWAHGEVGNPIFEMATALGQSSTLSGWDSITAFVKGVGEIAEPIESLISAEVQAIECTLTNISEGQDQDSSLGLHLRTALSRIPGEKRSLVETYLLTEYENLYATRVDELSLRYRSEDFHLPGNDRLLLGPLSEVVTAAIRGHDVRTNHQVDAVSQVAGGWVVRARNNDGVETFQADAVIVTVPIGVLQRKRIMFEPPLPLDVLVAINVLNPGEVAKVFFAFDECFWGPRTAFYLIDTPTPPLGLWVDVSALAESPVLCAFATGEVAHAVERMDELELIALGTDLFSDFFSEWTD